MSFPESVVDTSFGKLKVWSTRANHVGFRTIDASDASDEHDGITVITLNGVPYRLRVDLHPEDYFGEHQSSSSYKRPWHLYDGWGIAFGSIYLDRVDDWSKKPTDAARSAVIHKVLPELRKFIDGDLVQGLIADADYEDANSEVDSAAAAMDQARAELQAASERRDRAIERLSQLQADREARSKVS